MSKIIKNIPAGSTVEIEKMSDGSYQIIISEEEKKEKPIPLGKIRPGNTVVLGGREYIVLRHSKDTTAIIAKKPTKSMAFGIGKSGDYTKSDIRVYCNGEFYKELCKAVGKHNIIPHTVNLVSDDGSNKGATVKDNVSILTCDLYRRYREFLPAIGSSCWTATRVTTLDKDYARYVCVVNSGGVLRWGGCGCSDGVRPFCILDSSVVVG